MTIFDFQTTAMQDAGSQSPRFRAQTACVATIEIASHGDWKVTSEERAP